MRKAILGLLITNVLFFLVTLNGCKKANNINTCNDGIQNGTETGVDCGGACAACTERAFRIKTITNSGSSPYTETYTYDNKGRIKTILHSANSSYSATFIYENNKITETIDNMNSSVTYTLNSAGYADIETDKIGLSEFVYSYEYDSDGHLIMINGSYAKSWTNGNLSFWANFSGVTYSYLLDKNNTIGNENRGLSFLGNDSKNLVDVESRSGLSPSTYAYQYDAQNRVIQKTDGAETQTYTYY